MFEPLTPRQAAVLEFIEATIRERECAPTIREIAQHFGIGSPNGVVCHLRELSRKGYIAWERGKSRTIRLRRPNLPAAFPVNRNQ